VTVIAQPAVTEETLKRLKGNKDDEPTTTFVSRLPGVSNLKKN
jgi:hypothetical protein